MKTERMRRWKRWAVAAAACLAAAGCVRSLTVARERTVAFNGFDAMQAFSEMNRVLANSDGPGDFACAGDFANVFPQMQIDNLSPQDRANLEQEVARRGGSLQSGPQPLLFLLQGDLQDFQGPRDIMTEQDLVDVLSKPAYVKVVGSIHRCAGGGPPPMTQILGCAGAGSFVVKDLDDGAGGPNAADAGVVWAHEYGHTVGLGDLSGQPDQVMNGNLSPAARKITQSDCMAYTLPVDGDGPDGSLLDPGTPTLPATAGKAPGAVDVVRRPPGMPVETFARQTYHHGLTYAVKLDFDASDTEPLLRMLADPADAPHRENVLALLGLLGDERVGAVLIDAVEDMRRAELPWSRSNELTSALLGLGVLANHEQSSRVLQSLQLWADPASWTTEDPELARHVQVTAMMALALSGLEPARETLTGLRAAAAGNPRMQRDMDEIDAMARAVDTRGLAAYMLDQ